MPRDRTTGYVIKPVRPRIIRANENACLAVADWVPVEADRLPGPTLPHRSTK